MNDVNNAPVRDDVMEWPEGELPEQGSGFRETLLPGIHTFQLPNDLAPLWDMTTVAEDQRPGSPTNGQKIIRPTLKFDKNHPLVIVDPGKHEGDPFTATFSTNPRARGKKGDKNTPYVSDAAYLHTVALQEKTKPTSITQLIAEINAHGGKTVRLEHGLSAQCRPDKVRYIGVTITEDGVEKTVSQEDPEGTKGCGKRYYTKAFKLDDGSYVDQLQCECGALLRGFPQVEKILPPLGSK